MALYPLAAPYLLNPASITVQVTFPGAIDTGFVLGIPCVLLLMGALASFVFRKLDSLAGHVDKPLLVVADAVFAPCWPRCRATDTAETN